MGTKFAALGCCAALLLPAARADAREGLDIALVYTADVAATLHGGSDAKPRYLDNLDITLDADLAALADVPQTTVHLALLGNAGARPNDAAGTLQGVNNIEVGRHALRLFEAWAETSFKGGSLRAGLYDLNSEFYATESASLLIAPPFGIGSEFAATGHNGPSIFPSSALAARLHVDLPLPGGYARFAVLNARARTLGDPGGVDLSFGDGVIVAGEMGAGEPGAGEALRGSIGAWTYTRRRDVLNALDTSGNPQREKPAGAYAMLEARLDSGGGRKMTAFLRGGVARGRTQPFVHSWQAGLLASPALIGRPASAFSLGVHQARTSGEFRAAQALAGEPRWHRERVLEVTYADALASFLTIQPDLQLIEQTGPAVRRTAIQTNVRLQFAF